MKISSPCVVGLTWVMKDSLGEVLDELDEPVEFFLGGRDLLEAVELGLIGKQVGDRVDLHLEPEQAFGDYDENRVFLQSRQSLPEDLEEGMLFEASALTSSDAQPIPPDLMYVVTDIYPDHVVLDGNHPLAGIAIRLHLRVASVRQAQPEEIGAGTLGTGFFRLESAPMAPQDKRLH
jgi:FKBP-type peptidyl-prolyl cis-trans isomerase SlyD